VPLLPTLGSEDGHSRPPAVRWLSLPQLIRTGFMVAQARSFALFTDQRESMAGSPRELYRLLVRRPAPEAGVEPAQRRAPAPERAPTDDDAVWVDYVSDTGDGFRTTVATGRCVSGGVTVPPTPPGLEPDDWAEAELVAEMLADRPQHADLLVLGGDEVYPVGSPRNYRERLNNPLRIVGQLAGIQGLPPVAALPGNHDWYDGLAAFRRNFCESQLNRKVESGLHDLPGSAERDAVGAWGAFQTRSYFAVKLRPGWWLWAVDSQLDAPIDMEQLNYFRSAAVEVRKGRDRIILCTATPSWLEAERQKEAERREAYVAGPDTPFHTLLWFIARVLGADADRIRLILTGDQHYYTRHVSVDRPVEDPVLVTCGGGGAFLSSTHHLGDDISFDSRPWEAVDDEKVSGAADPGEAARRPQPASTSAPPKIRSYHREISYPSREQSKSLHNRWFLRAAYRNGRSLPLAVGLADIALLVFLIPNMYSPFHQSWAAPKPLSVVVIAIVGTLLWTYALSGTKDVPERMRRTGVLTFGHTSAHVVLTWLVALGSTWVVTRLMPDSEPTVRLAHALAGIVMLVLGMVVFVTYLYLADRLLSCHTLEAFSGMRIDGYKSHLRLRVQHDRVDVWAVGMDRVPSLNGRPNEELGQVPLNPVVVDHFTVRRGPELASDAPEPAAPAVPAPAPAVEPPATPEPARARPGTT
jgi:hypothetical protein